MNKTTFDKIISKIFPNPDNPSFNEIIGSKTFGFYHLKILNDIKVIDNAKVAGLIIIFTRDGKFHTKIIDSKKKLKAKWSFIKRKYENFCKKEVK